MAYYTFDETGREVLDHGTAGHHGTLEPSGPAATRVDNQVADFDGVDDYLQLDADTWFDSDLTIEVWVYPRSYNDWSRVLDFGNGPDADNVVLALSTGATGMPGFGVRIGDQYTSVNSSEVLPLNTWSHLAVVLNGNRGVMYIDGREVGRNDSMNRPASVIRKNAYIGRSNWANDAYANARFDELRIWELARSQTEIQRAMHQGLNGRETGLLAYYDFEDRAEGLLTDRSGNGHVSPRP